MRFCYYNANPLNRRVNDCTVRAISLATNQTWDNTYIMLSEFARLQCIMPDEVYYIDEFLNNNFIKICGCKERGRRITVGEFVDRNPKGTFLITMNGHITCCVDGCIYDTFNPEDRIVWGVYQVEKRRDQSLLFFITN